MAQAMLLGIEDRGQDATGIAYWDKRKHLRIDKAPRRAKKFVRNLDVPAGTRTFIGHTRWATQGAPENNANNHPIQTGPLVGIHNGVVFNDDRLFSDLGPGLRIAEVDSEAIFATLAYSGLSTEEALDLVQGSAAVAWYDEDDPLTLHLARVSSSPLIVAKTRRGSFMFASTRRCITDAAAMADVEIDTMTEIEEGVRLSVRHGEVLDLTRFRKKYTFGRTLTATERIALGHE